MTNNETPADEFHRSLVKLLKQQLNLSILFATAALQSSDPREMVRNRADALNSYNAVLRIANRNVLEANETQFIIEKLRELEKFLVQLDAMCNIADRNESILKAANVAPITKKETNKEKGPWIN